MVSQVTSEPPLVTLSVRVSKETADGLKRLADAHYRPVAAEMRRLIEDALIAAEPESKAAA